MADLTTQHHVIRVQCRDQNDAIQYADVKVEIVVDMAAIARWLGKKALSNKSKKSKGLGGDVTVSVIRDVPNGWKRTGY